MKKSDFAQYITEFLTKYLSGTRNLSFNTIASYRDAFMILIKFMNTTYSIRPEKLSVQDFTQERIKEFLEYLEVDCSNSISTRNQRLAAIHSFFRYISMRSPEDMFLSQQILAIPEKKKMQKLIKHYEMNQIKELLATPDSRTVRGRRDQALLCLLYDSGCRVQELADIKVCDIRITIPPQVTLTGKGRKKRVIPLTLETREILDSYMMEHGLKQLAKQDTPLFCNCHGNKLTRQGITYILKKYTEPIGLTDATPHILRHSKAMHMTEADINPIFIRDFLGHTDLKVTQIYSKTSVEMKRSALNKLVENEVIPKEKQKDWTNDTNLMDWLNQLGR